MANDKRIIAVVGATGAQGGGLARAILAEPEGEYAVRALTRHPDSDAARELEDLGAEVVRADLDDESSVAGAFDGAFGAFLVTNYWDHGDPGRERAQAGAMARAAKVAGVRHAIWSTLDDTRDRVPLDDDRMPTLHEVYKVPHFDVKGESDELFTEAEVPTTFLRTTFYWENLLGAMSPQRRDGDLVVSLPMGRSKLAGIAVDDIGRIAFGVFKGGERHIGETIAVAGEHLTGDEIAAAFSKLLGEKVVYEPMPFDAMRSAGFPGADDMANMFQYYTEFDDEFTGDRDLDSVRRLNPELQTFEEWLAAHREAFAGL
ncbi:NmrA/HSCARG family protein [Glycomyces sp. L485]|uniref:NmrA/HSCARG family protein n=1 Tax=Glycomyces sp. L485 TaxID=2909235 RepID=UPI001F4BC7BA|nr:NmrA/HSCARG family protein [Glycomyces sp. L485]MCH7232697.1 NmrA/HSCARG family protein [Glycomyces sp. L485]